VVTTELTRAVARLLLAPALIVSVAVLVKGYADVGDGFAGGVIAALAVLLQHLALGRAAVERVLPVHRAAQVAVGGLLLALAMAFVPVLAGSAPLEHAPAPGVEVVQLGSLELITAVAFDVGIFALVLGMVVGTIQLIAGAPPPRPAAEPPPPRPAAGSGPEPRTERP
jgi:multisubunit Na+/H+ antiporter MnhB subunit